MVLNVNIHLNFPKHLNSGVGFRLLIETEQNFYLNLIATFLPGEEVS